MTDRLFETHVIRRHRACDPLWTLTTPDEGGLPGPEKVLVPGVWESHPRLQNYRGRGVYEQRITAGGHVRVLLGGVSFRARVYLDGELIGSHYGAYTAFEAVKRDVPEGSHVLRVVADNRFGPDSALHVPNDYYAYGGINRPVMLEELGCAYIKRMRVRTHRTDAGWRAAAVITVRSLSDAQLSGELSVSLAGREQSVPVTLAGGAEADIALEIDCGPVTPWSPEEPALYQATAILRADGQAIDDLIDRVGFREVRVDGGRILLNGLPLTLKGFNRHEEYGGFGLAAPVEAMLRDIQMMRDMGANCVRTCHYPNDPRFLDLCDELGLLVWEEAHARGLEEAQMRNPCFLPQSLQCAEEMVLEHYNHPSIFIWGCLNECADDTEYGAQCYRQVLAHIRALDGTRPVTAALLERPGGRVYGDMDVVSVNLYPLWYHETPVEQAIKNKLDEIRAGGGAGKPVIVSEIGAGAVYGFHDPLGMAKWSEERQAAILSAQISAVLSCPDVSGLFLWQFADVRVDESWAPKRPRTYNNKGVVNEYRQIKTAYLTVRELYGGR